MPPLISVKKFYWRPNHNNAYIIKEISMDIFTSELKVVRGRGGSGKSKILQNISMRDMTFSGIIEYRSRSVKDMSPNEIKELRKKIVFLDENSTFLKNSNVYSNLEYILSLRKIPRPLHFDIIMKILKQTEIIHKIEQELVSLSRSEYRRFTLALAVLLDPELLIMDYNLSDSEEDRHLIELISAFMNDKLGCVLSIQDNTECKGEKVSFVDIDNGKIV